MSQQTSSPNTRHSRHLVTVSSVTAVLRTASESALSPLWSVLSHFAPLFSHLSIALREMQGREARKRETLMRERSIHWLPPVGAWTGSYRMMLQPAEPHQPGLWFPFSSLNWGSTYHVVVFFLFIRRYERVLFITTFSSWGQIHMTKPTVLGSEQFSGIYCIHSVIQPPPLSGSEVLSSPWRETLYPLSSYFISALQEPAVCLLSLWVYLFWTFHINAVFHDVTFCI